MNRFTRFAVVVAVLIITVCTFRFWNSGKWSVSSEESENATQGKERIVFANWASTETATKHRIDKVIRDFESLHPELEIVNQPIPFDFYENELIVASLGGRAPDVIQLGGNLPALLGSMGVLQPLDPYANRDGYLEDVYGASMKSAGVYRGTLYSVPFALTPHGMWYNKKLMKEAGLNPAKPPRTMEELTRQLQTIKEKLPGIYGIGLDMTMINYAFQGLFPFFQSFGADRLLTDPSNPAFDSPEAIATLSWFRHVISENYTPLNKQIKVEREMMAYNKIVFKLDGPYFEGIIRDINPELSQDVFDDTFGVSVVPAISGLPSSTAADIHTLGMSKQAKNKEAAWEFIEFLTSSDSSVSNYIIPLGMIPTRKSVMDRFRKELDRPFMQTFIHDIIPTAKPVPYSPQMSQAGHYIMTGIQGMITGSAPEDVAKSVNRTLLELYKEE